MLLISTFHLFEHFTMSYILNFLKSFKLINSRNDKFQWIEFIVIKIDNLQFLRVQPHSTLDNGYGTIALCKIYQILSGNIIEM